VPNWVAVGKWLWDQKISLFIGGAVGVLLLFGSIERTQLSADSVQCDYAFGSKTIEYFGQVAPDCATSLFPTLGFDLALCFAMVVGAGAGAVVGAGVSEVLRQRADRTL
jgi:hypothetical protein